MAVIGNGNLVSRSARGLLYPLGELTHVCAVYLGIAVLVTVVLGMLVPSLRDQARQIHTALVVVLRPGAMQNNIYANFQADAGRSSGPQPNFADALKSSEAGQTIPGVTQAQAQALRSYIARKYKIAHSVAGVLIHTAFIVGKEKELDPQLLLAVIAIESRYNPYAESHVGAQGLMQVMTKVHKEKFDVFNDGVIAALNPIANMRVGSQILLDCINRRGTVEGGLACYVGATGPSDGGYGAKVLAERRRIALASGIPVGR
ncbi:MAG TPA: lytic transglycosylase domain-containing protein [Candidimonas sp.]|nr:lytic transglycosylase domain-containing protein [Candidimonas sp.]